VSPEAVAAPAFGGDLPASIRLVRLASPAPSLGRPIYLALCTLLI